MRRFINSLPIKRHFSAIKHMLTNEHVSVHMSSDVPLRTTFEGCNTIGKNTYYCGDIGYGSYIGSYCQMSAEIGRFCSISDNVKTIQGVHPISEFITSSPMFFSISCQSQITYVNHDLFNETVYSNVSRKVAVTIGNDVWIGSHVLILAGVTIGDGAVIGAGAVVTKNIEPYTVVGGCPARKIRDRFPREITDILMKIRWWEWPPEIIQQRHKDFLDPNLFLSKYKTGD